MEENFPSSDQQSFTETPEPSKEKKKLSPKILAIIFLAIVIVVGGGYWVWNRFLSEHARIDRQTQEQYGKYLSWEKQYEEAMKNDTYGGTTPQETLDMFIEALKQEDVELASKYFLLDENLSRDKWEKALLEEKNAGGFEELVSYLGSAEPAGSAMENYFGFEIKDAYGVIMSDINMKLNKYSNVWKIESL